MRSFLLASLALAVGCSSVPMGAMRIDPALAALVPSDSIVLAGVRMNELRSTALYQKLAAKQRLPELDEFSAKTRFDPRRDVNDMLVASNGADSVVLARGSFHVQTPAGVSKSVYKGVTLYGSGQGAYAILDPSTAVAGPELAVKRAIDQKQSGHSGAGALLDRARALAGQGQIWFVANGWGTLPEKFSREGGNMGNLGRISQGIVASNGVIDLRLGIVATLNGDCRNEQDAKNLGDTARGLVGLGRLSVPENQPELLKLFDGIKVDQKQSSIQINVNIPAELIDSLLRMTEGRVKRTNSAAH